MFRNLKNLGSLSLYNIKAEVVEPKLWYFLILKSESLNQTEITLKERSDIVSTAADIDSVDLLFRIKQIQNLSQVFIKQFEDSLIKTQSLVTMRKIVAKHPRTTHYRLSPYFR